MAIQVMCDIAVPASGETCQGLSVENTTRTQVWSFAGAAIGSPPAPPRSIWPSHFFNAGFAL